MPEPEIERLLQLVKTVMRMLGVTNRELARRLGINPSHLSRILNGQLELKVEHLLNMSAAMGLQPDEFFRLAYPTRTEPPTESAQVLRGLLPEGAALAPPSPPASAGAAMGITAEEIDRRIQESVRKLFQELGGRLAG
ncbi:MAG TPA: helix-turn-helix transcriptional regulator [Thermoanaerobaculia bacterium]